MEKIYKPSYFNATEHINIKEYFDAYKKELYEQHTSNLSVNKKIESFLEGFTSENIADINKVIDIDNLTVPNEQQPSSMKNFMNMKYSCPYTHKPGEINDESRTLGTIRAIEDRKQVGDRNLFRELRDRSMHVYDNRPPETGKPDLQPGEDVIIKIRLFCTFTYRFSEPCSDDVMKFDQEITLLGSNTLADLRDTIKCTSDMLVLNEISENPDDRNNLACAKKKYPSGFFFIDGIFYNDFRSKRAIDYSEVLRKWAREKNIADFQTSNMQTSLLSLSPRFGYPYVYQHQGRCEHVFIFSHAKLLTVSDPLNSGSYPYHSDVGSSKSVLCFICGACVPVWMVVDCDRLPQSNTPLCNDCFTSYLYLDKKKIGNFKAYPYTSRSTIF